MIAILMATLMSMSAPQTALPPNVAPSGDASDLLDPFAARHTRSDAAAPAPSDLIDPFNHPPRRTDSRVECEPVLRDPFAPPAAAPRTEVPRTGATFPGLLNPFAE